MAMIFADVRETHGANPYLGAAITENNKKSDKLSWQEGGGEIKFAIKKLTVGDYSILIKDKINPKRTILAMVIERKTWKDLAASIKDERIVNQCQALKAIQKKKNCQILFLIEGKTQFYADEKKIENMYFKGLHAKVRHNLIRGFPYLASQDEEHSAKLVVELARDFLKLYRRGDIDFPVPEEIEPNSDDEPEATGSSEGTLTFEEQKTRSLEAYCQAVQKINQEFREKFTQHHILPNVIDEVENFLRRAQNPDELILDSTDSMEIDGIEDADFDLPEEISKNKVIEDSDIVLNIWKSIPGISAKSAVILMNKFHISDVVCVDRENLKNIQNQLSELKMASGRRFGEAKAKNILALAYQGTDEARREKLYDLSVKLLSQAPSISLISAKTILEKYTLRDICNGYVSADTLFELKNKNNRRFLSLKNAERMIRLFRKPA